MRVTRRSVVLVLALSCLAAPRVASAQSSPKVYRIGTLSHDPSGAGRFWDAFRDGMREHGYVEGRNIVLEQRYAEGRPERFAGFVTELLALKVDVILVVDSAAAHAAKRATTTTPIVFTVIPDPDQQGLVASLARPGGTSPACPPS
jgi:putative ABC transport system substrate-binding protein